MAAVSQRHQGDEKMQYLLALTALVAGAAALAHASPCTSTFFDSEGPSCTDSLTNVGGVAGADETITLSDFTNMTTEATGITSTVDLEDTAPYGFTGLAGFTFNYLDSIFFADFTLGYTATITACATGFTCAITGYFDSVHELFGSPEVFVTLTGVPSVPLDSYSGFINVALNAVNLQTATITGYYNRTDPVYGFECDVLTSVTPIPEPANLSAFGAGLLGIALLRRRWAVRK
jgi:hypothetical protein